MTRAAFDEPLGPLPASPRASIVVCNYNHGRFLDHALRSAVNQTYPCQVIVIDDGSTDDSLHVLETWADRVTVVSKPNGGQRSAYNVGFERSDGDIVLFLDADDSLVPDAVARVVAAMTPGVSRVHFKLQLMNEAGTPFGGSIPRNLATGDLAGRLLHTATLPPSAPGSGNAYRRAALERMMPLPLSPIDKNGADFFAIYGTSLLGRVVAIPEPLAFYRVLDRSRSSANAPLVFGNAAQGQKRAEIIGERVLELRNWVRDWSEGDVLLPEGLADFGEVKSLFAQCVFRGSYFQGLTEGSAEFPRLLHSVLNQREFSWAEKVGLLGWAATVLVAPRKWGKPIARYVVDPASRGA